MLPLCGVANCFRGRRRRLSRRAVAMLTFAGLRGAIAFALALDVDTAHKHTIKTTTLAIVLLSTFVHGGATLPMLRRLGIVDERKDADDDDDGRDGDRADGGGADGGEVSPTHQHFLNWDRRYLTPIFCRAEAIPAHRRYAADGQTQGEADHAGARARDDCLGLLRGARWRGDALDDAAGQKNPGGLQAMDGERARADAPAGPADL